LQLLFDRLQLQDPAVAGRILLFPTAALARSNKREKIRRRDRVYALKRASSA
jgi:hypothetical protein